MHSAHMKKFLDYVFLQDAERQSPEAALVDKFEDLLLMRAPSSQEAAAITRRRFVRRCNATSPTTATSLFLPFSMSDEEFNDYWQQQEGYSVCCCGDDMDHHADDHSSRSMSDYAQQLRGQELAETFADLVGKGDTWTPQK